MIEDMTLAGLAEGTQKLYIHTVRRLAAYYRRSPDEPGEEEVRGYLPSCGSGSGTRHLQNRSAWPGTSPYAWPGLGLFGKKDRLTPAKWLPDALSDDQAVILSGIRNPVHKTCLAVMHACGLRISEATTLEVSAIDRANQVLRIVGKGNKERLVPLHSRFSTISAFTGRSASAAG
jgi:integrase